MNSSTKLQLRFMQALFAVFSATAVFGFNVELRRGHTALGIDEIVVKPAIAQAHQTQHTPVEERTKQSEPSRPRPKPRPRRWIVTQRGAGSRSCGDQMEVLLAQTNEVNETGDLVDQPTFEIKIPYSKAELMSLNFILQDEGYEEIYRLDQLTPSEFQTVQIEIPEEKLNAEAYRWFIEAEINCPPPQLEGSAEAIAPQGIGKPRLSGWLEPYVEQHSEPEAAEDEQRLLPLK